MIDLPESTNVYKKMPKELFYKYLNDASTLKKTFIDEIRSITWINTLTPETMAIPAGSVVTSIAVVEIILNRQAISTNLVEIVSREIDDYAIYFARYEEWGQIWCSDQGNVEKRPISNDNRSFHQTNWGNDEEVCLNTLGRNLDEVYENWYFQVTGKDLHLKKSVVNEKIQKHEDVFENSNEMKLSQLEEVIRNLEVQIDKEKQFSKQVKLVTALKNARNEMEKTKRSLSSYPEKHENEKIEAAQASFSSIRSILPNVLIIL